MHQFVRIINAEPSAPTFMFHSLQLDSFVSYYAWQRHLYFQYYHRIPRLSFPT